MNKKKTGLVLSILGIISLVLITTGVTYAFFNYSKQGITENTVTTGTITFIYEEIDKQGSGISITNAYPISDEVGKSQSGTGKVFNFSIKSETTSNASIPYTVTARMKKDSTLDSSVVKMYLTEVSGDTETELLLDNYSNLTDTTVSVPEGIVEKVIYTDTVPSKYDYEKKFRLRMWIDESTDFSQNDDGTYPYNGKTFAVTVNVYSNANVVTKKQGTLLKSKIMENSIVENEPTLTSAAPANGDVSGLYMSTATNDGTPTYYFRGQVENNYVTFAGQVWRIIRINEDGTIRIITTDGINNNEDFLYNSLYKSYENMYYTNSEAQKTLNNWYNKLTTPDKLKIASGDYYCEQAKVKYSEWDTSENAVMALYTDYKPDFKCSTDGNNKGIVNSNIGLITYDEVLYAGGYVFAANFKYYLSNYYNWTTMSPAGLAGSPATIWFVSVSGDIYTKFVYDKRPLRPVINLKADTIVTGTGTDIDPYVVQ